jgi:hypothetical protein
MSWTAGAKHKMERSLEFSWEDWSLPLRVSTGVNYIEIGFLTATLSLSWFDEVDNSAAIRAECEQAAKEIKPEPKIYADGVELKLGHTYLLKSFKGVREVVLKKLSPSGKNAVITWLGNDVWVDLEDIKILEELTDV